MIDLLLLHCVEIGGLWEELPSQPIGVLVNAALSGRIGVGKVGLGVERGCDLLVQDEFCGAAGRTSTSA